MVGWALPLPNNEGECPVCNKVKMSWENANVSEYDYEKRVMNRGSRRIKQGATNFVLRYFDGLQISQQPRGLVLLG